MSNGWTFDGRKKWVKSSEVSKISKRKDFQLGLLVLEVTYDYVFKDGTVNIMINFTI